MLGLFDGTPFYCPVCGKRLSGLKGESRHDYLCGASCVCPECRRFHYEYRTREQLLKASEDLARYAERGIL